jgi:hypothetical protein
MKKTICVLAALMVIASFACKKDSSTPSSSSTPTPTPTSTVVTVNSSPQFTGTINDTGYSLVTGSVYSGGTVADNMLGGSSATYNTGNYSSYMDNLNTGHPFLGITKGTMQFALALTMPDTASFDAFFAPGVYTYSSNLNTTNGIQIQYINAKGDFYSTAQGSADQTGSTFTITAKRALGMVYGQYEVAVMATFTCKLYSSTGASITLTNGVYVGDFSNQ